MTLLRYFSMGITGMVVFLVWFLATLPDVSVLRSHYPVPIVKTLNQQPEIAFQRARPADWVALSEIANVVQGAVIISEDGSFYDHEGVDWEAVRLALKEDLEKRRYVRGASTLSQQLVKNVFLTRKKSVIRKLRELVLTMRLEQILGKRKILEVYFNIVEWGPGIYGIKKAADFYFQKMPRELTAKEAAFLAMLLPNPKLYGKSFTKKVLSPFARNSVRRIVERLAIARYIEKEEVERILSVPLSFETAAEGVPTESDLFGEPEIGPEEDWEEPVTE